MSREKTGFHQLISIFSGVMQVKQRAFTAWDAHAYANRPLPEPAPVGNLMYSLNYNEPVWARELFNKIPVTERERILNLDFSIAEQKCPQKIEIGKLIKEACCELS
jgi:hypothetical protein